MQITSEAFSNNGKIPEKYTCDGENISPPLEILQVPEGSKSLVLIMDDPDSVKSTGKIWDHWVLFNIPTDVFEIEEDTDIGIKGMNSFENKGYGGACPTSGEHSYLFRLYAIDTELDLKEGASKTEVEEMMKEHIIETAELIGRYSRE